MDRSFLILRKDTIERKICGYVLEYFEKREIKINNVLKGKLPLEGCKIFYKHILDQKLDWVFKELVDQFKKVIIFELVGEKIYQIGKKLVGKTNPEEANINSIRGRFGYYDGKNMKNIVHFTKNIEDYKREKKTLINFFNEDS